MTPDDGFGKNPGFLREIGLFLLQNKKWWLIPLVVVMALFGVMLILAGTGAAPFIYSLF